MPTTLQRPPPARRKLLPFVWNAGNRRDPFNQALPFLLGSMLLCTTTLTGQVSGWVLLIFLGCTVWRLLAERRGWELPSMVVRAAIFVPSVALVAKLYGTQPTAGSLLAFLIVLLALKVLELRTARDFTVVALLGYFMVLSGLFYDQSFALCLYLGIAVLFNTFALIRVHLGQTTRTFWPVLRLACGLLLQATPLVVLLFIIFPRVQVSFLRRISNASNGTTGMSDHLQPGSIASLTQSNETAFRVLIIPKRQLPQVQLPQTQLYWRGVVLSKCEGDMSWRPGSSPTQYTKLTHSMSAALWWSVHYLQFTPYDALEPSDDAVQQRVMVFPSGERWLFALDRPVKIVATTSTKPRFNETVQVLSSAQVSSYNVIYNVFSDTSDTTPFDLPPEARKYYTQVPRDVTPRVLALVQGWQKDRATPAAIIRAAEVFFRDSGFTYTLSPGALPQGRALEYFLFESRRGFCEHYAAAFCSLMRAGGIPCRIVVGYQGGEVNKWSGWYSVKQSDAHAWCEVWLTGRGWQRVDPTGLVAPERVNLGADSFASLASSGFNLDSRLGGRLDSIGWVHWLKHNTTMAWESIDQQWNNMVIGYDPDVQFSFLQSMGLGNFTMFVGVALAVAAAFSILVLGAAAMQLIQGLPGWWQRAPEDAARTAYDRFCRRLADVTGLRRKDSEGPLDYAARATVQRPDLAEDIEGITRQYVNLRYTLADSGLTNTALAGLQEAIRKFRPVVLRAARNA